MTARTLVAGFGNVLRGDDGFGVEVIRRLAAESLGGDVELMDVGTGGIRLAQELLGGYARLIVVDAMRGEGEPGTLYVRAVDGILPDPRIDMHLAVPSRALALATALNAMPPEVFLIGCEPLEVEELTMELSPPVRRAVDGAVRRILELVRDRDAGGAIRHRDEVLELLYWLEGEGFAAGTATRDGMIRFLAQPPAAVDHALEQLLRRGDVVLTGDGEYRLTETGRREAGRRFAAEFAPLLGQGHGECNDPECECHTDPLGAADCRVHRTGGHGSTR